MADPWPVPKGVRRAGERQFRVGQAEDREVVEARRHSGPARRQAPDVAPAAPYEVEGAFGSGHLSESPRIHSALNHPP